MNNKLSNLDQDLHQRRSLGIVYTNDKYDPVLFEKLLIYTLDSFSWNNRSPTGWNIDHVIPLSFFDLTDQNQLKIACS